MCWLKRDLWKAGITFAGMLLLLVAIAGFPVSAANTHEEIVGLAGPGTVTGQVTPTEDATVTALNKEKLAQEVQQLKNQNEPDPFGWLRTNASILLSTLVVVIGALVGLFRWLADRRDEHEKRRHDQESEQKKRAEERFQSVVEGLGSEREEARVGAAIVLRTFLLPGYEQFYRQVFDLAVAHLRLQRTSHPPDNLDIPLPLTPLRQALIIAFRESFPLARDHNHRKEDMHTLDAAEIQLDNAFLGETDLSWLWMPSASLREGDLFRTNLMQANLRKANLTGSDCPFANLSQTDLQWANLSKANLRGANLSEANLSETNIEDALSLKDTNLRGVTGLTTEQKDACKAKGAIIDATPTTSPSRSPVSPPPPSQSNDLQAPSVPPT